MNYWVVFLTGLTTGGLSCLAVQGGLLTSVIANQKEGELNPPKAKAFRRAGDTRSGSFDQLDWMPVGMFLGSKLIVYTILGFGLGALGSILTLSLPARLIGQAVAAIFMLATAGNLLELHPLFRYALLQPPKWVQRLVRNKSKSRALFAPAVLGGLTIFIPCGVTQAMEVVAITSGSPVAGTLTMGAFVLGTLPLFAILGVATAKLSEFWREKFLHLAAGILIVTAFYSLNGILTVMDAPVTAQKIGGKIAQVLLLDDPRASASGVENIGGLQRAAIGVTNRGYSPRYLRVKLGVPVELTVQSNGAYSCATAFTFKKFNLFAQLKPVDKRVFKFTPTEKGKFTYSCSMGMYTGTMEVI